VRGRLIVRDAVVRTRTRSISLIRALLRQQGYRVPSGSAEACVQRVAAVTVPGRLLSTLAPLLAIMRHLNAQLAYSDQAIEHLAAHDARVQRLRNVPSIGPVTATAFVATIDDVQRFRHAHQVEAYLGLWSWALRIAARRGTQAAVVARARRLAGILYAPLRDGSVYEPRPAQSPGPVATVLA
jgi:transposase